MSATWARAGLLLALGTLAFNAHARPDGEKAAGEVAQHLRANDCPAAIQRLNDGLKAGYPQVAMMAGTMFDVGICVAKDWNKAVGFYVQASDGGIKEGAYRLAAGFAADENGPDTATAMWWAARAGMQADFCTAKLPKTDDPDRFVEELKRWPAHQLAVCNFVVGTIAFISADVRYPFGGVKTEIDGNAEVSYLPASNRFRNDARGATNPARKKIGEVMVQAIRHAGARYAKPAGIDPHWELTFDVTVDTDKSRWW
ncbi:MAG: hypothetical protein ACXWC4_07625 [Telluria sp.]